MKILILVLSTNQDQYSPILDAVKKTWYSHSVDNIRKIFYYGNSKENILVGDNLYLTDPERLEFIGPRTLNAFEYVKYLEYDYIVRVNAGSYIHQENLLRFLQDKPLNNFYCGIVGNYHNIEYASGSAYIISRDLVDKLIQDKNKIRLLYPHGELCIDGVATGEMVSKYGVRVDRSSLRISYCNSDVEYQIGDKAVEFISDDVNYHYRLRSNDRQLDIKRMYDLHNKFYGRKKDISNNSYVI